IHAARGRRRAEEKRPLAGGQRACRQTGRAADESALGLRRAVGIRLLGEKARQVAPGIAGGLDLFAADREQFALNLAAAESLIKKAARIVAQYPDDRRAAPLVHEPLEQREQQPSADPLV